MLCIYISCAKMISVYSSGEDSMQLLVFNSTEDCITIQLAPTFNLALLAGIHPDDLLYWTFCLFSFEGADFWYPSNDNRIKRFYSNGL